MKKKKMPPMRKKSLADQYWEIVKIHLPSVTKEESLEQPHRYKFVDSVTTYGAYQNPI
jgi:hypothetical protein